MSKVSRRERQAVLHRQKQKQRLTWGVLGLGVILIFVALIWSRSNQVVATDDRFDAEMVVLGRQVYDEKCAICHGEELEGEVDWRQSDPNGVLKAPPHDETGHTWHHADAYLIESIKLGGARLPADVGISPMPAYEGVLTDVEITAVLTFIKSQWPTDILAAQEQR
jgi:mono/diheme cytochrome c family protein